MRQQITWEETKGDSVNGFGVQIHYLFTSFDKAEIDELKARCEENIADGLVFEPVRLRDDREKHNETQKTT